MAVPLLGTWQAAPQVEQLFGSLVVSVHCPPQSVWPLPGQLMVHALAEQTSPVAQALAHAPQFSGSEARATQAAPHAT